MSNAKQKRKDRGHDRSRGKVRQYGQSGTGDPASGAGKGLVAADRDGGVRQGDAGGEVLHRRLPDQDAGGQPHFRLETGGEPAGDKFSGLLEEPSWTEAINIVAYSRGHALAKHGSLKDGTGRWDRLLWEEMDELSDELNCVPLDGMCDLPQAMRIIQEAAQVAQLAINVIQKVQQALRTSATLGGVPLGQD